MYLDNNEKKNQFFRNVKKNKEIMSLFIYNKS